MSKTYIEGVKINNSTQKYNHTVSVSANTDIESTVTVDGVTYYLVGVKIYGDTTTISLQYPSGATEVFDGVLEDQAFVHPCLPSKYITGGTATVVACYYGNV